MTPFTDWASVPLVADIHVTARVLDRSVKDIRRAIKAKQMHPAPLPIFGDVQRHHYQWSKEALQAWLGGGYLAFEQAGVKKARRFFGSASRATVTDLRSASAS